MDPASPDAEPYREPVQVPWAAHEGRLRLLDQDGELFELTWGRTLPDGSTLIDVMSPSVSLDGERILFAGRKDRNDRWRIYEVHVDGSGLRPLTGGPKDPGCIAVPPLRFRADGSKLSDRDRKVRDYDDIDPTDLGPNGFAFASSRLPDLGRDHSRRATQIWTWAPDSKAPVPVTANRNNDRWPVLIAGEQILFSLWSRNREAVKADLSGVEPVSTRGDFATRPADNWMAAVVMTNAAQFSYGIKSAEPVWRPRPLFNGRIVYMTAVSPNGPLKLAQADWGYIQTSPSSAAKEEALPYHGGAGHFFGPDRDAEGRELIVACPSPAPGNSILFAASPTNAPANSFGIYRVADDWSASKPTPERIFDDPEFVDAEPVAVYARRFGNGPRRLVPPTVEGYDKPERIALESGKSYSGPMGLLENVAVRLAIRNPIPWHDRSSGKPIDPRVDPVVSPPTNVASIAVYSAGRDRFDHPDQLRIPGSWEKQAVAPLLLDDDLRAWIPGDPLSPSVIVGLDAQGKVARWTSPASGNRPARTYFAYAGDHYSGIRANGYHYCNGCHAGHTFLKLDVKERSDEPGLSLFSAGR
ncbi:TolB-like translocation protein [Singulisphaera rosea]